MRLPSQAVAGFETFLECWGSGGAGWYCLVLSTQWEIGSGRLLDASGSRLLMRVRPFDGSSGSGVKVNFTAGDMDCFAASWSD